ncbi:hypothetical protein B0T13DRAFT_491337 [Neurospora crassa]|nr:hypothetical protein B0T13DRAFT_491337 [Neurospora crassa]
MSVSQSCIVLDLEGHLATEITFKPAFGSPAIPEKPIPHASEPPQKQTLSQIRKKTILETPKVRTPQQSSDFEASPASSDTAKSSMSPAPFSFGGAPLEPGPRPDLFATSRLSLVDRQRRDNDQRPLDTSPLRSQVRVAFVVQDMRALVLEPNSNSDHR